MRRSLITIAVVLIVGHAGRIVDGVELVGAARWQATVAAGRPAPLALDGQTAVLPKDHLGREYLLIITIGNSSHRRFLPTIFTAGPYVHFARVGATLELVADTRGLAFRPNTAPRIIGTFPITGETSKALHFTFHGSNIAGLAPTTVHLRSQLTGNGWATIETVEQLTDEDGPITRVVRYTLKEPPTPDFQALVVPAELRHRYFTMDRFLPSWEVPMELAMRWEIRRPISFSISPNTPLAYRAAIREGALAWNAAFGREVVTVDVAPAGVTPGDPRYNLIQWVEDDGLVLARGESVADPLTGQIIYAMVEIASGWAILSSAESRALEMTSADGSTMSLEGLQSAVRCTHDVAQFSLDPLHAVVQQLGTDKRQALAEQRLRAVVMHEIGHVLGLRHNFAGSLDTAFTQEADAEDLASLLEGTRLPGAPLPSSSIMDYLPLQDDVRMDRIGKYDEAAIAWLYGITASSTDLAELRFCTDDHLATAKDVPEEPKIADCQRYDHGMEPIDWWIAEIERLIVRYNEWIVHHGLRQPDTLDTIPTGERARRSLLKEIYETREAIMAYLNPGRTIWLLHDQFPNERREYAAKAWGGVGTSIAETAIGNALTLVALPPTAVADDPLVRPVLAAKISQLTALSSGSDTRARWSQYTLEQIGKYLADLHTILGK